MDIKTGEYVISYYNKYGAKLKYLQDRATNLGMAKDIANRRVFDIVDQADIHYLPTSFTIDRRIVNSMEAKG